ncbi:hypothetical protein HNY73_002465 [Argiope bruennichi]|uniref:Uncharacterized protein n=1 Tax=Argiope bruennichi TaxID=94029 RepID=A0A8T0FXY2_ARGBR|nr:hypothetical protein HNY73_002465 [Argiope bruennichi]
MQLIKDFAWSTFVTLFIFTIVESSSEVIEEKNLHIPNQWNIDLENDTSTDDTIYYSRTADLIINVEVTGNWSNCVLNFFYEEVEFKEYRNDSSDREGKISPWISMEGRGYRPNNLNNSEDSFGEFRERLASLGTEYAYNNSKNLKIDSSQVHIVRVSAVIGKKDILYVMVKIQHAKNGKAIFTWNQLGHILKEYSSRFSSEVKRGYWIKHCTEETHQRKWANIIIYAIAPVLCCICLLIWNWRNTPFSRIFSKKIKMAIIRSKKDLMAPVEDNEYLSNYVTNTVPKVRITNDEGRRYTWNNDDGALSSGAEQDSDIEVFNRRDLRRSSSSRSNTKVSGSARSSSRSLKRPEINMAFKNEECIDDIQNIPETSTPATEHAYDTVNSQKSLLSTNSTFETKL